MDLLPQEIRVLGCLLEKQRATPDQYPLTLNSLRLACNQSTNRDPVVDYDDDQVRDALRRLERRGMVRFAGGAGSRAPKYRHLLAEALPMDESEQAVIAVLMLRGPQTPGELKQRTERLHQFVDLQEVHDALGRLEARSLVFCLPRRRGQKEERFAHGLGDAGAAGEHAESLEPYQTAERQLQGQAEATEDHTREHAETIDERLCEQSEQLAEQRSLIERQRRAVEWLSGRVAVLEVRLAALEMELGVRPQAEEVRVGEEEEDS
jgi:uncharacterized protein YceH (UPF0502 family)